MAKIEKNSRCVVEFSLEWSRDGVYHQDNLWADPVDMWRDCLVPEVAQALAGKAEGDKVAVEINPRWLPACSREKIVAIRPEQFVVPASLHASPVPHLGRFYPQGFLRNVDGVFRESVAPARFVGVENGRMIFDLNHPLAGQPLKLTAQIIAVHAKNVERGGRCEDWLERLTTDGPGMQARYHDQPTDFFSPETMGREDESDDATFYEQPRLVQHLDAKAREAIGRVYQELVPGGGHVLDFMGSWDSHIPSRVELGGLTVLGMNQQELDANPRAAARIVRDMNADPSLPFEGERFDAIVCTASIEYLTNPLQVMSELQRVLRPGGVLVVAFSNRWFPGKAVKGWTLMHEFERLGMVLELFRQTPGFEDIHTFSRRGLPRPEDDPHWEIPLSDPVYMVWGRKLNHGR